MVELLAQVKKTMYGITLGTCWENVAVGVHVGHLVI
jgi:hypothetical protein